MRQPYSSKLEIPVPICISFEAEGMPQPVTGWIARLSLAGVDIEALEAPAIGSKIQFHAALDPDAGEVLTFSGTVRWVTGGRVGVQFLELGARETRAILEAMRVAPPASTIAPPASATPSSGSSAPPVSGVTGGRQAETATRR
jgi:hypothetical protein